MLLCSLDYNLHDGTDYFKQFPVTASNHLLFLSPLQVAFDFLHILCAFLLFWYLLWFSVWYITAELTIKHLDSSSCCNGNILWHFKKHQSLCRDLAARRGTVSCTVCVGTTRKRNIFFLPNMSLLAKYLYFLIEDHNHDSFCQCHCSIAR